ncbi:MAG: glycosyl hydrolase family 18 protein [Fluviibacter sp.]
MADAEMSKTATCKFLKQQYGIKPMQTWGSLRDLDLRAFWDKNNCNARVADPVINNAHTQVPTHLYWGNWNTPPYGIVADFLKQASAVLINAFWDISANCQIIGRQHDQELALHGACAVLAGVGGWGSTTKFSMLFKDGTSRQRVIQALGAAVVDAKWQGIAIDWEYPSTDQDWMNLCLFLEEYRRVYPLQTLAVAVPADDASIPARNVSRLSAAVDFLHVMTYDFTGEWSATAQHNSSLTQGTDSLKAWEKAGALRSKLMLGSAWYGRRCMAKTIGATASGPWKEDTYADIQQLRTASPQNGWAMFRASDETPWMQNLRTGELLSFEDMQLVSAKVKWVADNAFGGVFCWELGQDSSDNDLLKALLQI